MTKINNEIKEQQRNIWETLKTEFLENGYSVNKKFALENDGYKTILGLAIENNDDEFIKALVSDPTIDINGYVYFKKEPFKIQVSNALQYAARFYTLESEITKLLSEKMHDTADLMYFKK